MTLPSLMSALLLVGAPAGDAVGPVLSETAQAAAPAPVVEIAPPPVAAPMPTAPVDEQWVTGPRRHHAKGDPLEGFNRGMFGIHQTFDKAIFRPVGLGYKHVVPKPLRSGLRHFFVNLTEPIVFVNYLLQLKPGKAIETLARFSINSVLGIAGLVDVAKGPGLRLPHRNNGLGDTLGYYGVKPGPYIFLPLVGPTSLRDFVGGQADGFVLPLAIGTPFDRAEYQAPKAVLTGLDLRAESEEELRALFDGAVDPYATLRSAYQQNRQGEIDALHGKARATVPAELGDDLADPAGGPGVKPATPEMADPLADPAAATEPAKPAPTELNDPLADPAQPAPKS